MESAQWGDGLAERVGGMFLLRGTPPALARRALADDLCTRSSIPRGDTIYTPRAFSRSLGLLLSGSVQVSKETLILNVLRPGACFGAAALFNDATDYVTTLTALDDCDILLFQQPLVADLMAESPAVARNYIAYLSGRIRFLNDKIEGLILGSAERKLAQYLSARARDGRAELDCSATGLAQRLNVSRASLYRAFDALAEIGAAKKEGRFVHILDDAKLQSV